MTDAGFWSLVENTLIGDWGVREAPVRMGSSRSPCMHQGPRRNGLVASLIRVREDLHGRFSCGGRTGPEICDIVEPFIF